MVLFDKLTCKSRSIFHTALEVDATGEDARQVREDDMIGERPEIEVLSPLQDMLTSIV